MFDERAEYHFMCLHLILFDIKNIVELMKLQALALFFPTELHYNLLKGFSLKLSVILTLF